MITIRRINLGEWELFRSIRLKALKEAPYAFSSDYESALQRDSRSWMEQVNQTAEGNQRCTFLALLNEEPVGIAAVYRDEEKWNEAEVLQVWVSPEQRRTGLSERLMNSVIDWAQKNEIEKIFAGITKGNERALRFYKRIGFCVTDLKKTSACDLILLKEINVESVGVKT